MKKIKKAVLIVDNHEIWRNWFKDTFEDYNKQDGPYEFTVATLSATTDVVERLRAYPNGYDLVVMDIFFEEEGEGDIGLDVLCKIQEAFGNGKPLRIMVSGISFKPHHVDRAKENGGILIKKATTNGKPVSQQVLEAALAGLQKTAQNT